MAVLLYDFHSFDRSGGCQGQYQDLLTTLLLPVLLGKKNWEDLEAALSWQTFEVHFGRGAERVGLEDPRALMFWNKLEALQNFYFQWLLHPRALWNFVGVVVYMVP